MDKYKKRIDELKEENRKAGELLVQVEQRKTQIIQESLIRNGRILELENLSK